MGVRLHLQIDVREHGCQWIGFQQKAVAGGFGVHGVMQFDGTQSVHLYVFQQRVHQRFVAAADAGTYALGSELLLGGAARLHTFKAPQLPENIGLRVGETRLNPLGECAIDGAGEQNGHGGDGRLESCSPSA